MRSRLTQLCPRWRYSRGDDLAQLVRTADRRVGAASSLVSRGDVVVIKPNIGWDRTPEQAANTNPAARRGGVPALPGGGGRRVIVTDVSFNDPRRCFERSGHRRGSPPAGAQVILPEEARSTKSTCRERCSHYWPFSSHSWRRQDINFPIAKHHSLTGATLGMKNWYGILGGRAISCISASTKAWWTSRISSSDSHHDRSLPRAYAKRTDRRQS